MAVNLANLETKQYNIIMIYTIGYAGTTIDRFIEILEANKITLLIDVRSLPKSQYFDVFNDNILSKSLANHGIKYENWKEEFGARQDDLGFYTDGILDYDKFAKSDQFKRGIAQIKRLSDQNVCLMCAEIDPIICHRAILCGREIANSGLDVIHIIAKRNGETILEPHSDFEIRLLQTTKINNLSQAYLKQSKKIGYKLTK